MIDENCPYNYSSAQHSPYSNELESISARAFSNPQSQNMDQMTTDSGVLVECSRDSLEKAESQPIGFSLHIVLLVCCNPIPFITVNIRMYLLAVM